MNTYGDVATRVRAALVEGFGGQQVRDWPNATRLVMVASVQAVTVTEDDTDRQVTTTSKRMNTGVEVLVTDRVEWHGNTYEVEGVEPAYVTGRFDHYEAALNLIEEAAA